jgi:hypothetical protein
MTHMDSEAGNSPGVGLDLEALPGIFTDSVLLLSYQASDLSR